METRQSCDWLVSWLQKIGVCGNYDVDGYYEDNKSDYDNYDDAYDAFEDDEGSWDDYWCKWNREAYQY